MPPFPRAPSETLRRISLPRHPEPAAPHPFPLLATIAPIFAAVALWWITSSPFALVFAFLGPVVAVASLFDARISARRSNTREKHRFERDCAAVELLVAEHHSAERAELARLAPGAGYLLGLTAPYPDRWQVSFGAALAIRLGAGSIHSHLDIQGDTSGGADPASEASATALAALRASAQHLAEAPVIVDGRLGIGLFGPRPLVQAAARAIGIQVAAALSPAGTLLGGTPPSGAWLWMAALPHGQGVEAEAEASDARAPAAPAGASVLIFTSAVDATGKYALAVADHWEELPRELRVVVSVTAQGAAIVRHPDASLLGSFQPDFASAVQAGQWARRQAQLARSEGLMPQRSALPARVDLAALLAAPDSRGGLDCTFGVGQGGPVTVDLAGQGPHAVVGGTTGSGKSELLVSWVLAMAAHRPPAEVTFLFVDFKGGAAFEPLRALPHCVGVITDLAEHEALRALASLKAEVRHRERTLARAGLRSLDDSVPGSVLPRLVIVVDEYAAMVDEHPDLHLLFADLAARGRSLGMHLVLCTQRPAGVVRDGILANCGLRISLRVNNRADSQAVLGVDAAASLSASSPGRAIVMLPTGAPHHFQVAHSTTTDVAAVGGRWAQCDPPRTPWCAPLPALVLATDLEADFEPDAGRDAAGGAPVSAGVAFALVDLPREQRRGLARYDPRSHGNVLVLGAAGAGKSGALAALAAPAARPALAGEVTLLGASLPAVWDAVTALLAAPPSPRLLLLDDVDVLVSATPEEYSTAVAELLTRLLREGPAVGLFTVIALQRLSGMLHSLVALCSSTVLLRMPNRQEHILAGGESATWDATLPPGGGYWRGDRIQLLHRPGLGAVPGPVAASTAVDAGRIPLAVVSTRPRQFGEQLRLAVPARRVVELGVASADPRELLLGGGGAGDVLLGDPDSWQSRWGSLSAVRATANVLFDGCSAAEFRSMTGIRDLPPPVQRGARALWLLAPDGTLCRAHLPVPPPVPGNQGSGADTGRAGPFL